MSAPRRRDVAVMAGALLGSWLAPLASRAQPQAQPQHQAQTPMVRLPRGDLVAADIGAILHRGELVVAMAATDAPPFFHVKNNRLVGSDVRMAEQLAGELRVTLRIDRSPRTFNEVIDFVAGGSADLGISKLSHTLARALSVHFSDPYLTLNHALLLNRVEFAGLLRDRTMAKAIRNFDGSLAVIAKSSFADFAPRHFPQARIVSYPTWEAVIDAVRRGQVMGAYRDEFEVRRILQEDPGLVLMLRTVILKDLTDALAIAVGVRNTTLLAFVNKFVGLRPEKLTVDSVLKELR